MFKFWEVVIGGTGERQSWRPAFGHLVARKLKQTTANVELAFELLVALTHMDCTSAIPSARRHDAIGALFQIPVV